MSKAPVLFVGHGSPMNAIGENRSRPAWKKMGEELGKPKVIIAISAHWMTNGFVAVRKAEDNPQVNDMYGFPQRLYDVKYAPKSDVKMAEKVLAAIPGAQVDNTWGIDHGVWSVLCNMYPEADVPVVMVSVDMEASPEKQFEVGRSLRALREEDAMIVCSGNVVHNLEMVNWRMKDGMPWADEFDIAVRDLILKGDFEAVVSFDKLKDYQLSIPTTEHYFPLLTALGATYDDERIVWNEYRELGSMSMTSYLFKNINTKIK